MPEYLSPGVYIEEQDTGPEPIEGVSTSVTGFVGVTQMGPLDGKPPILVTSFPEFTRTFGSYFTPGFPITGYNFYNFLPHAVAGFFNNGGQLLYIKRVAASGVNAPATATVAAAALENGAGAPTLMTRLLSSAPTGATTLYLASMRGIENATTLTLVQVKNGVTTNSGGTPLAITAYDDVAKTVTLAAALPAPTPVLTPALTSYDSQYTLVILTAATNAPGSTPVANTGNFALQAANAGVWGNNIAVQITPSSRALAQVVGIGSVAPGVNNQLLLNSGASFYRGAIIEINTTAANTTNPPQKYYAKVQSVNATNVVLTANLAAAAVTAINGNLGATPAVPIPVRSCEFDIVASYGTVNESFRGLTLDNTTPYYYATAIINGSTLLGVPATPPSDQTTTNTSTMPVALDGLNVVLSGGSDGAAAPTPIDFGGNDGGPGNRTGIAALIDAADISIIGAPGITDQYTQSALITQCENLKYRFAILDPAPPLSATSGMQDIQNQRGLYDTKYAAIYYPRVVVTDPLTDNLLTIPPSGHMAGIYAQTDDSRGVWKAPANIVIDGINSLETKLSKGDQDILNPEPNNINALRDFTAQDRGLRVYGARCITSDEEWKYINVRRLFIFIEASLDQGTQWAVFEPNDETLWNRLIQSVSNFLTTIWREGGLMGAKVEEAFFVKCGYDTMTQDDIENGRLIMLVGIAPVFPAEFVIIRIGQWAGGSSVQEL
jgi:phage tail sheath protein FI